VKTSFHPPLPLGHARNMMLFFGIVEQIRAGLRSSLPRAGCGQRALRKEAVHAFFQPVSQKK